MSLRFDLAVEIKTLEQLKPKVLHFYFTFKFYNLLDTHVNN